MQLCAFGFGSGGKAAGNTEQSDLTQNLELPFVHFFSYHFVPW